MYFVSYVRSYFTVFTTDDVIVWALVPVRMPGADIYPRLSIKDRKLVSELVIPTFSIVEHLLQNGHNLKAQ